MKKIYFAVVSVLIAFAPNLLHAQNDIVITEIMYNPPEFGNDSLEFIEIYNNSSAVVDLSDWTFSSGVIFTFPAGVTIPVGGYVVTAKDSMAIVNTFGYSGAYEWSLGGLSNSGEALALRDNVGVLQDTVRYDDTAPWPSGTAGDGASLILCDVSLDNNLATSWLASDNTAATGVIIDGKEVLASPGSSICPAPCVPTAGTDTRSECAPFNWIDGNDYSADNNTATFTIPNAAGCDSVITLDLTIIASTSSTDVHSSCGTFTWIDGNDYSMSNNTATHTIPNAAGCDSVITLDLTITGASTSSTDTHAECAPFTWIDGNDYSMSNNTATHTIPNAAGCDSVITLDLTILASTSSTDVHASCGTFTWIDGNDYSMSNNTATHIVPNAAGCDSIITLDLTINSVDKTTSVNGGTITANATGATYVWIDCDDNNSAINGETAQSFTPQMNGNYAVIVTENNCSDTSDCVAVNTIGLSDNSIANQVVIHPNPTHGEVTINFGELTGASIQLFNTYGQLILRKENIEGKMIQFEINEAPGVYMLEVQQNGEKAYFRLLKQ